MAIVKMINSPRSHTITGLHGTLSYCCREAKTNHEGQRLITGINCVPQFALQEFMNTKRLHKQNGGRMYYHMVQSFPKDENITPETAHEIALKLAETIPGFEIVVATHCDADHVHSHFVINSVSYETGKKYHSDQQSIHALWDASDKLCLQYGLSVIKRKQTNEHRMNDREYRSYMRGNSWKMALEIAIDDCMTLAYNREHFMQLMEWRGYEVTWSDTRKNITYSTPQGYKCRDRKLNGRKYLKEEMEYEFDLRKKICRRLAGETEANDLAGRVCAENGSRHRTQLAGADRVTENGDGNRGADFGTSNATGQRPGTARVVGDDLEEAGGAGDARRTTGHSQSAGYDADAASERDHGCNGSISSGDSDSYRGSAEDDCEHDDFDRSTLWAAEREVFQSNLRRAAEPAHMDAAVFADQRDPQPAIGHLGADTAFMLSHLSEIIDDDEHDDYYTRMARRGPTLSM